MHTRIVGFLLILFPLLSCSQPGEQGASAQATRDTVAILGTGDMGDSFGPRLAALGYPVIYGSRRPDSEKVRALVAHTGHGAKAANQKDAAQQADIILLALPWPAMETVTQNLGDMDGKVMIDISWPPSDYADDGYERITIETSAAEMIQSWNPRAMVVKAFLTLGSNVIDDPSTASGPVTVPIASDHRYAKEATARMAADLGLDPVDVGPLRFARNIEAMAELMLVPYAQGRDYGWDFYFPRTNYFVCNAYEGDGAGYESPPIMDAGNLATIPNTQDPLPPCP